MRKRVGVYFLVLVDFHLIYNVSIFHKNYIQIIMNIMYIILYIIMSINNNVYYLYIIFK